ncbi:hypothetical protein EIJ50_21610 [Xanthomonas perforans]|nr:hypothetical protein EIJ50_21610 [Xanthomonas perforans]
MQHGGVVAAGERVADLRQAVLGELLGQRHRHLARPRQVAMAFAKALTEDSPPAIGDAVAGRDHPTVAHA